MEGSVGGNEEGGGEKKRGGTGREGGGRKDGAVVGSEAYKDDEVSEG